MIRVLIRREFAVSLSEVSVGRLMRRLGFSPQRPLYRAWQQDPALVERWRAEDYPKIAARAKREGALIYFADESGIRSDHHAGTTWAPVGQTPVVKATGARYGLNLLSAVNALGHFRFMTVEGRGQCRGVPRVPQAAHHRDGAQDLSHRRWASRAQGKAGEPFRRGQRRCNRVVLPALRPGTQPRRTAWGHIKTRTKATTQTKGELKAMVERVMRRLQKMPEIVVGFFHAPTCAYAKA